MSVLPHPHSPFAPVSTPLRSRPTVSGPLISVVIPAYNVQRYIAEAVDSVLAQTYRHLEVIVVDDGSVDGTAEVVNGLIATRQDPRLRLVQQQNKGLPGARNTGIAHSRGAFIGFLDGDDRWHPDKARAHVELLMSQPRVGLTFSHSAYMSEVGEPTGALLRASNLRPTLHDMLRRNHCGNGSTVVARRECFEQAGTFTEHLRSCEDYEMWCRLLWATPYRAAGIAKPLTHYRQRVDSLSFNVGRFTEAADEAMALLRAQMPHVPAARLRAGHAEHYRIAALKASTSGQDAEASALLARAFQLWPRLFVTDLRALATAAVICLPGRLRKLLLGRRRTLAAGGVVTP